MVCRKPLDPQWTPATREREKLLQHHSTDQPEAHEYSSEMRRLADGYGDRVLIGEIFLPNDRHERWYGTPERPQVHPPFNFQLIECAWDAAELRQVIGDYEGSLPAFGWSNWVLGSHDAPRISARIGEAQARIAAMLLLTLRGTPMLYRAYWRLLRWPIKLMGLGKMKSSSVPPRRLSRASKVLRASVINSS